MIREIVILAMVLVLAAAGRTAAGGELGFTADEGTFALGVLLLCGFIAGRISRRLGFPGITGYLLLGVFVGPWIVRLLGGGVLISERSLQELRFIDSMALGLIAFTAGGELKIAAFKGRLGGLFWVSGLQMAVVFAGVAGLFLLLGPHLSLGEGLGPAHLAAAALLLGAAATANSPATAVTVIQETRAAGPLTRLVLGVTVLKDVLVIAAFAGMMALARILVDPGRALDFAFAGTLAVEVGGSVLAGLALGWLVSLYIERVGRELPLVVLALAFTAVFLAQQYHFSGLMICMVCGFIVENFSAHGETLIKAVERYSLPVYVIFFAIAGASLSIPALLGMWGAALLFVGGRGLFTYAGSWIGARIAGEKGAVRRWLGAGFIGQAGVTLGFAALVSGFEGFGPALRTLLLAAVGLNQVAGPILLKWSLDATAETGKAAAIEEPCAEEGAVCEEL